MRLHRPLARVRRRLRLQAALEGGAIAAVVAAALLLVGVYLWRLHAFGGRGLLAVGLTAGGLVLAGVVARAIARIPLERAALHIDASHGLHDRVRSALAFAAEPQPTPFMQAAMDDAEQAARAVDVKRAAPLSRPAATTPAAIIVAVAALVALLRFPARHVGPAVAARPPHLVVDRSVLDPEMQAARALEAAAKEAGDVDAQELAQQLNRLLTQIDAEELTRKQAFDKLAELENKYLHADDGELEYLKDKLRKAGAELGKSKLTQARPARRSKTTTSTRRARSWRSSPPRPRRSTSSGTKEQREEAATALERSGQADRRGQAGQAARRRGEAAARRRAPAQAAAGAESERPGAAAQARAQPTRAAAARARQAAAGRAAA